MLNMIKLPKCNYCSDTKQILNSDSNAYQNCPHCNRTEIISSDVQESYIMNFHIGTNDPECITRELEDLGVIDEDTGQSNIKNVISFEDNIKEEYSYKRSEQNVDKNRDNFFD